MSDYTQYLYLIPATLLAMTLHEFSHGYVSWKLGDPTPKAEGRLSLNPLVHIDPVGAICMILFHVGFAKPVMINPYYYKNPKRGTALVSAAGPAMNLVTGTIGIFLMTFMEVLAYKSVIPADATAVTVIYTFLYYYSVLSINLGIFNLIPLPPLDGSKILGLVLPDRLMNFFNRYHNVCTIILLVLIYAGFLNGFLDSAFDFLYGAIENLSVTFFLNFI